MGYTWEGIKFETMEEADTYIAENGEYRTEEELIMLQEGVE